MYTHTHTHTHIHTHTHTLTHACTPYLNPGSAPASLRNWVKKWQTDNDDSIIPTKTGVTNQGHHLPQLYHFTILAVLACSTE